MIPKVNPGQRLNIPATSFNAFVDAAEAHKRQQTNQTAPNSRQNYALQHLEITEILEDHLICVHVNPDNTVSTVPVYVWKPFVFQGDVHGGAYEIGDRIFAAVTDVMGQVDTSDSNSIRTVLVDVNVDGGGMSVSTVETLPAIPTSGYRRVFWTSDGDGTGDDQCWEVFAGQSAWTPCQYYTTKSGTPVIE